MSFMIITKTLILLCFFYFFNPPNIVKHYYQFRGRVQPNGLLSIVAGYRLGATIAGPSTGTESARV